MFPPVIVEISIHAPAKGATQETSAPCMGRSISIHAPAKGATTSLSIISPNTSISIHAPAKGATLCGLTVVDYLVFQSTLPRRERRSTQYLRLSLLINFNPRSREGSDVIMEFEQFISDISIHAPAKGATLYNCQKEISI